ncbi:DISP complex protein LRCH3 isoform X1 [Maylandia zebra]|uniref:Leucine-rich repeat and calponin homology domain-containing protein 3 isoform X1 n=3 Tax=Haplochromini TaxID=319058 RepID=A0A9Y3S1P3_9CICH|nr:PREDICTED: leucine-rich repeat and calponin homology domain-containing protein 3 isoform X1 [Pundamilia nyererei]XP_014266312.1 leucine-rich repeat and calponin homology domain-containing protein 3 isoform X1 [Maylandia zebra]XP_026047173.1 leucine-rich repeat and calponin homology domain-containing protein 3 isoform X1 [Astatotilapia calliptera]
MAASVLLGSADSAGLSFTIGGGGTGNSNGLGPAPWNRSLDRALDEAAATGSLNLSGRKLKEFPRCAANHDLTDTTRADLSRNRLSELPLEVCLFVSLESLNLYQNCLRSLPDGLLNLQALTYLNLSRNQLSVLPAVVCGLPLKVLIACNNKLVSLPEELGQLRHLTELDVSCNEIQTLPAQVGQLEALRDLNIRRNHLVRLPPELAELPLVRLDFSCNKVTSIPVCYRRLTQLQTIVLDNNPLQTPPAQICIKGKVHIFKYLNLEASKTTPDLPEYDRRPLTFSSCVDELYPGRPYGALDSGFNSVDSGDKRWLSNEASEELSELPQRVADISRDQRQRGGAAGGAALPNGTYGELEQIDFIDSCAGEEEEEEGRSRGGGDRTSLSSQFMAYIERRITREGSPVKSGSSRMEDPRRHSRGGVDSAAAASGSHGQRGGVERMRREAQLAAMRYDEERQKNRSLQRDNVSGHAKHKAAPSPTKASPDTENVYPSRRSTHTDDSALFMGEDRAALSPTANQSPSYPSSGGVASCRTTNVRPESFLFRLAQREEKRKGDTSAPPSQEEAPAAPPLAAEDVEVVEQLRKNIEARLKVSLPSDLGAALTDGVVLCHLANHVRPRSVPSIHVPSPAVPKLTMAKCRRNVENFLEACRRIGVPQDHLCSVGDVLEGKGGGVYATVEVLLSMAPPLVSLSPQVQLAGFALFYLSVMSVLCAIYVHLAPHV